MKTFTFCTSPVDFTIESNCNSPEEALDEALKLGSQELHALDGDGLANCCEFLDIEILTDDYYLGETE